MFDMEKVRAYSEDAKPFAMQAVVANRHDRDSEKLPPPAQQVYSLAAVATHCSPSDCWVVIRNKVYDVTSWVPKHPGGALIYINAGKDCTQLFDAYHPLYVRYCLTASR